MSTARGVLDAHAELSERWRSRDPAILRWIGMMAGYILKDFPGDTDTDRRARSMFYPWQIGEAPRFEEEDQAAGFMGDVGRDLFEARSLQITPDMMGLITEIAGQIPGDGDRFEDAEIPWDSGFAMFDQPLVLPGTMPSVSSVGWVAMPTAQIRRAGEESEDASVIRAISWAKIPARLLLEDGKPPVKCRAVRIVFWTSLHDVAQLTGGDQTWADRAAYPAGDLVLVHTLVLPLGRAFGPMQPRGPDMKAHHAVEHGSATIRFLHALWMVMDMEITVIQPTPVPRQGRKRAEGKIRHNGVNIITLRRAKPHGPRDPDAPVCHREIDWSCRWFVRGHYRHLVMYDPDQVPHHPASPGSDRNKCAVCDQKISKFIHPYIKGPAGAPLRTADALYKLSR